MKNKIIYASLVVLFLAFFSPATRGGRNCGQLLPTATNPNACLVKKKAANPVANLSISPFSFSLLNL